MKSIVVIVTASLVLVSPVQQESYKVFMNSFVEIKRSGLINFERISQKVDPMSREEALKFVYAGDTSKLSCVSQNINMITEKKGSLLRSTRFPNKCMLLKMDNYFLLAYVSYECRDPSRSQQAFLTLVVVNKQFKPVDKLIVYKASGDFTEVMGLLNSSNGKVFLDGLLRDQKHIDAVLYTVDDSSLKFRILKESSDVKGDYSNFAKTLKTLGWEEIFNDN